MGILPIDIITLCPLDNVHASNIRCFPRHRALLAARCGFHGICQQGFEDALETKSATDLN